VELAGLGDGMDSGVGDGDSIKGRVNTEAGEYIYFQN